MNASKGLAVGGVSVARPDLGGAGVAPAVISTNRGAAVAVIVVLVLGDCPACGGATSTPTGAWGPTGCGGAVKLPGD